MTLKMAPGCTCCERDYCIRPNINWPGWTGLFSWSTISDCCWQRDFIADVTPTAFNIDSDMVYRWYQKTETYHRTFASIGDWDGSTCSSIVSNTTIGESWCKFLYDNRKKLRVIVTPSSSARLTVYLAYFSGVPYYCIEARQSFTAQVYPLESLLSDVDYKYVDGDCFVGRDGAGNPIAKASYDAEPSQPAYTQGTLIATIGTTTLIAFGRVAAPTLTTSYTGVEFSSGDANLPTADETPCLGGVQDNYSYSYNFGSITESVPTENTTPCAVSGSVEDITGELGAGDCFLPRLRRFDGGSPGAGAYLTLNSDCCVDATSECNSTATLQGFQRSANIDSHTFSGTSDTATVDVNLETTVQIALWA